MGGYCVRGIAGASRVVAMNDEGGRLGPYEIVRQSPTAFFAKADEARYVAYCLWQARSDPPAGPEFDGPSEHKSGSLFWGFLRESSLALELISKAVFAQRQTWSREPKPVPGSHNVPQLWKMAALPALPPHQEATLYEAWQILVWTGRYPAPTKDENDLYPEVKRARDLASTSNRQDSQLNRSRWDAFDEVYQVALSSFFHIEGP